MWYNGAGGDFLTHLLVVDDEVSILELIKNSLGKDGYLITVCQNADDVDIKKLHFYDLILLDVMMPGTDGFEFCKQIRNMVDCPILFLTAKTLEEDILFGLGIGADDYITKPFSITEVMARIKANIRRNTEYAAVQPEQTKLVWGPLVMNLENHTVTKSGEIIELTAKEFDILRLLLENPQRVYTKAQIYSLIWNDAYMGDENAVNVHISRLRTKIEDDPRKPQVVITVWGIGYKLGEQK